MKKYHIVSFLLGFIVLLGISQVSNAQTFRIVTKTFDRFDFYSDNHFSLEANGKGGAGVAGEGNLFSALLNPAAFQQSQKIQMGFGYGLKSNIDLEPRSSVHKGRHPALFSGIGYRFSKYLHAGFIFQNSNNYRLDLSRTFSTGTFVDYTDWHLNTLAIPISITLGKFLRAGVVGTNNMFQIEITRDRLEYRQASNEIRFKFGIRILASKAFQIGVAYAPASEKVITEVQETFDPDDPSTTINENHYLFPESFRIGTQYQLLSSLSFSADFHSLKSPDENYDDRYSIHFGSEYEYSRGLSLRFGMYYLRNFQAVGDFGALHNVFGEQYYLTGGLTYDYKSFPLLLSIEDSHLFTGGDGKVTRINVGFLVNLN